MSKPIYILAHITTTDKEKAEKAQEIYKKARYTKTEIYLEGIRVVEERLLKENNS